MMNTATVDKRTFVDRLTTLTRIVASNKSCVPVLGNVYVGIEPGTVTLKTTDLALREYAIISATTEGETCAVTIPAPMMLKLLKKAPKKADTITLSVDEKDMALDVEVGTLKLHLKGIDAEEFPAMPVVIAGTTLGIGAGELMEALQQTLCATAQDQSRPILTGVKFSTSEDVLTLAAADGYRLAVRKVDVDCEGKQLNVIIPGSTLSEVVRELKGQTRNVIVNVGGEFVRIVTDTVTFISPLVEGHFPDYHVIIPTKCTTHVKFLAENLLNALSVVEPICNENAHIVRLSVNGSLTVTATSAEMGTASQSVGAKMEGDGGDIAFNVKYLKDAMDSIHSDVVSMGMNTCAQPAIFRPVGGSDYLHVLMPMNLDYGR